MCDFSQARGHGWWLGIRNLGPITSNYTPHSLARTFLGTFSADIYIQPNAPTFVSVLFFHQFPLVPTNCHKCPNLANADQMPKKYGLKMKAEVLDCRWYLFVCWLHMFGFGFRGFAGFPPGGRTLYTRRLILSLGHYYTPTLEMYGISSRVVSLVIISETYRFISKTWKRWSVTH